LKKHRLLCAKFLCASLLDGVCLQSRVDYAPHAVYEAIITCVKWIFTSNYCSPRRILSSHVISYSSRIVGDVVDTFQVSVKTLPRIWLNIAVRLYANYIDFNTNVLVYFHVSKDVRVPVMIYIQLNTDSLIPHNIIRSGFCHGSLTGKYSLIIFHFFDKFVANGNSLKLFETHKRTLLYITLLYYILFIEN